LHAGAKLQSKRRERAPFYNVTSAGVSVEISRRIGNMEDSKKPWRLKKFC
jgi:hypothetical protein